MYPEIYICLNCEARDSDAALDSDPPIYVSWVDSQNIPHAEYETKQCRTCHNPVSLQVASVKKLNVRIVSG